MIHGAAPSRVIRREIDRNAHDDESLRQTWYRAIADRRGEYLTSGRTAFLYVDQLYIRTARGSFERVEEVES